MSKRYYHKCLQPGKQVFSNKKLYAFDIETYGRKNNFLCVSIVGDDGYYKSFRTKKEFIAELQNRRYCNSLIASTNLAFDFFGIFDDTGLLNNFKVLFRGSMLLNAKTWLNDKNEFFYKPKTNIRAKGTISFIDTLNYSMISVKEMGKILGLEKIEFSDKVGKMPENEKEWDELLYYNRRDAEISLKYLKFLYTTFELEGATIKLTAASTSMSLFKNRFLKQKFYTQETSDLLEIFEGYYGGRTEAFTRGTITACNYYDVNSMYPYCMTREMPNPNTHRTTHENVLDFIMNYDGMSNVKITSPTEMKVPYLPVRYNNKLVFPLGTFTGWWTNFELRKALSLGYKILEVRKTHYYTENCYPLKDYALTIYAKRNQHRKTPMEQVYKLFMNSLYGKFGQRFTDKENIKHKDNLTYEDVSEKDVEFLGEFASMKEDSDPSSFCIPIWACYITAYARTVLYEKLVDCDPIYCDTDSIITEKKFSNDLELGGFKLEMTIKEGIVIRPKMYGLIGNKNDKDVKIVKVKGLRKKIKLEKDSETVEVDYEVFLKLLNKHNCTDPRVYYDRFTKFKAAYRNGLKMNEIIEFFKELDLEDDKREWPAVIDINTTQSSLPIHIYLDWPELVENTDKNVLMVGNTITSTGL